jgi:hypothetical protein
VRIFIPSGGPKAHGNSVESHVIPAKAGIQFLADMEPRFRGGDVLTFIPMGGPLAHEHSETSCHCRALSFPIRQTPCGLRLLPSADTGHIGSSLDERIHEGADTFAFVFKELGLTMQALPGH